MCCKNGKLSCRVVEASCEVACNACVHLYAWRVYSYLELGAVCRLINTLHIMFMHVFFWICQKRVVLCSLQQPVAVVVSSRDGGLSAWSWPCWLPGLHSFQFWWSCYMRLPVVYDYLWMELHNDVNKTIFDLWAMDGPCTNLLHMKLLRLSWANQSLSWVHLYILYISSW